MVLNIFKIFAMNYVYFDEYFKVGNAIYTIGLVDELLFFRVQPATATHDAMEVNSISRKQCTSINQMHTKKVYKILLDLPVVNRKRNAHPK